MGIINTKFVHTHINIQGEIYHKLFHGANKEFLGSGYVYTMCASLFKAKLCVCLGSGSGYVPRIMRQAQMDLFIEKESRTVIVDANLPEKGWGSPDYLEDENCFFRKHWDVEIIVAKTLDAAKEFQEIDYLHIDADHVYESVRADWNAYRPRMNRAHSFITLHDTRWHHRNAKVGVYKLVNELRESGVNVIDLDIGGGIGLISIEGNDPMGISAD